ncbi:YibE/F family protein [Staphylococcus saprophyticus]|nr:YibE/F family protein [Staphylococcus saprophyticus]
MVKFMVFTMVVGVMGGVIDLGIRMSSAMYELRERNGNLREKELFD